MIYSVLVICTCTYMLVSVSCSMNVQMVPLSSSQAQIYLVSAPELQESKTSELQKESRLCEDDMFPMFTQSLNVAAFSVTINRVKEEILPFSVLELLLTTQVTGMFKKDEP